MSDRVRDVLLAHGYVEGTSLWHTTGAGHTHDEASWAKRFPAAMRALYPGRALGGPAR